MPRRKGQVKLTAFEEKSVPVPDKSAQQDRHTLERETKQQSDRANERQPDEATRSLKDVSLQATQAIQKSTQSSAASSEEAMRIMRKPTEPAQSTGDLAAEATRIMRKPAELTQSSNDLANEATHAMQKLVEPVQSSNDLANEATHAMQKLVEPVQAANNLADEATRSIESINKTKGQKPPQVTVAAKLPRHSMAAAAQRLGDIPSQAGVSYNAGRRKTRSTDWRSKRHRTRKNLHSASFRSAAAERKLTKRVFIPVGIGIPLIAILIFALVTFFNTLSSATDEQYQTQVTTLSDILPLDNLKIYDASGHLIYQATGDGVQTSEPLNKISKNLQNAEIDIEDQTFWSNEGFDITGIIRAAVSDLSSGHVVEGGSTITQQLIKNTIVGNSDTALRKLEEVELAPDITRYYSKQQILDMYLNTVYYANGAYGAEAGAQIYFGLKDKPNNPASNQLDIAQAATLAGIPSDPTLRNPITYPANSLTRTRDVLHQMYILNSINTQQYTTALKEIQKPSFASFHAPDQNQPALALTSFVNYALSELASGLNVNVSALSRSGLSATTTVNSSLQTQVLAEAQNDIAVVRAVHDINDSSVVMINPKTGAIETLVGNIDPANNSFDVATQGFRQPGSTMKAFTYVTAFEHGLSPGQMTDDKFSTFYYDGEPYAPHNYADTQHGWLTYRKALDWSLNIDAVRLELSSYVGVQNDYNMAENLGLGATNGTLGASFTLGTLGVHLLNETSAYGTFANGGVHVPPHAINIVTNEHGKVIFRASEAGKQIVTPQAAYVLTNVLSDNATRDQEFYPCYDGDVLDLHVNNDCSNTVIPAAVKTGTTDDDVDNLTIGYTPSLVTGVWSGNDNDSAMNNIIGITGAGTIWHDAMLTALQGQPVQQFTEPSGVGYSSQYHDVVVTNPSSS